MRAISLTQPWAQLVALGKKTIETRSWRTPYTGPIAIHAAKAMPPEALALRLTEPFFSALGTDGLRAIDGTARGAIVAVGNLAGCRTTNPGVLGRPDDAPLAWSDEYAFGDYSPGRWMWFLEDVRALPEPIACRGALGLWDVPWDVEGRIARQLAPTAEASPNETPAQPSRASQARLRVLSDVQQCIVRPDDPAIQPPLTEEERQWLGLGPNRLLAEELAGS
jgi:hypothetical protein